MHTQKITNRCRYDLTVPEGPIRFVLRRGSDAEWIEPPVDPNGVCTVDVEMRDIVRCGNAPAGEVGDLPGLPDLGAEEPIVGDGTKAVLNEFSILLSIFTGNHDVRPTTTLGSLPVAGFAPIGSSDPTCPNGGFP